MIHEKNPAAPIVIDLTGPQGNAFYLLGIVKSLKNVLPPWTTVKEVQDEMMAGDYENLIAVFDSYFGSYVILER